VEILRKNIMKKNTKHKKLKEQTAPKPKGLPSPIELASRINGAGLDGSEVLAWLGDVLRRVSMGGATSTETEDVEVIEEPLPPTPAAVQEQLESRLLKSLLNDINRKKK
jgi:hypothetical protein